MRREKLPLAMATKAILLAGALLVPSVAMAQAYSPEQVSAALDFRDETLAYNVGLQAFVYGYPPVDFARTMYVNTTKGRDPTGWYAPVNQFYKIGFVDRPGLVAPGLSGQGRSPNNVTIQYHAWVDLRNGPLLLFAPSTNGRYYSLQFTDFYSEAVELTGRHTTGTGEQRILLVDPDWKGDVPPGVHLIRLPTHKGSVFLRLLTDGGKDLAPATALADRFTIEPLNPNQPAAAPPEPIGMDALKSLEFFRLLNQFLRENPRKPGEASLMLQFDQVGFGPNSIFDPAKCNLATCRGLERALKDGMRLVVEGRIPRKPGWTSTRPMIGTYGYNYLARATIEHWGLFGNPPEEAVYPNVRTDSDGDILSGKKRYRLVLPREMPVDAFWSVTAYDANKADFIPNPIHRYSIGDRTVGLKRQKDGSVVILLQKDQPKERDVNWLPVTDDAFFVSLRLYNPRKEVLDQTWKIPPLEIVRP